MNLRNKLGRLESVVYALVDAVAAEPPAARRSLPQFDAFMAVLQCELDKLAVPGLTDLQNPALMVLTPTLARVPALAAAARGYHREHGELPTAVETYLIAAARTAGRLDGFPRLPRVVIDVIAEHVRQRRKMPTGDELEAALAAPQGAEFAWDNGDE